MNNCIYTSDKLICQERIDLSDLLPKSPAKTRDRDDCAYASFATNPSPVPEKLSKPELKHLEKHDYELLRTLRRLIKSSGKEIHSDQIRELFGANEIGKRIAKWILFAEKSWSNEQKKAIRYFLNFKNYEILLSRLNISDDLIKNKEAAKIYQKFETELISGVFQYSRKDFRTYHDLQNIKSEIRDVVFKSAGYKFEVDISGCAWAMIRHLGHRSKLSNMDALDRFCCKETKSVMMAQWKVKLNLPMKAVKRLLLALLHGAKIGKKGEVFAILGFDEYRLEQLRKLKQLRRLIVLVKSIIRFHRKQLCEELGINGSVSIGKLCFLIYTKFEDQVVRSSWNEYFKMNGIRNFVVHDGCYISEEVDVIELQRYVFEKTGIDVDIEIERI